MRTPVSQHRIYEGDGDALMAQATHTERIVIIPDAKPAKQPAAAPKLRLMWGQLLLDDLLSNRYRSLICAVNADDNSHGIISQVAEMLPTSQWTNRTITDHARRFIGHDQVTVIKYDMDVVEVLALLRPAGQEHLTLDDLGMGFQIIAEMLRRKTQRLPCASVSFLGARANLMLDEAGREPTFETVLRTMHESGFAGDVYPAPWMWEAPTALYARYPFPQSITDMREGGF
ncbi:hypothetical protein ACERK3_13135 [Phycisphaerales bacterium AB-hyl4]|uniref:Uncharacterized protein n=1 Tax=Natronomicrosphaera hydrolytica TaxID=3242702 RepID=A0ABV4UAD2_9BACT